MGIFKSRGWDNLLEDDKNRWNEPNKYVNILIDNLKKKFKSARILDIGFGAGRHILYLHEFGFKISGFDIAQNAEHYAKERLSDIKDKELIDLKTFDMLSVPWLYNSNSFEGALAINTIHHTNYEGFIKIIDEISRVLVPSGLFLATITSKNNHKFGQGLKTDSHSYITDEGAEKGIPHCFLDENDINKIFNKKFKILKLKMISGEIPYKDIKFRKKGALDHWLLYAEKK